MFSEPLTEATNNDTEGEKPDNKPCKVIKTLEQGDARKAANTLYEAFQNDSLAKYLTVHITDPEIRKELEITLYECYLIQHIKLGLCLGIGEGADQFETVALWALPEVEAKEDIDSFTHMMECGFWKVWLECDALAREKIFKHMFSLLHDTFVDIMATDSRFHHKNAYTLVYLGSTLAARGKGNVRKMFEYMFENYIDKSDNNIAYLELSSSKNIPIYEKFGFKFYKDICLGKQDNGEEGTDYAVMNVMIRDSFGRDWTKLVNNFDSKGKL
mgnify:CR=1 FL=1